VFLSSCMHAYLALFWRLFFHDPYGACCCIFIVFFFFFFFFFFPLDMERYLERWSMMVISLVSKLLLLLLFFSFYLS
jgi:hypothetical protein